MDVWQGFENIRAMNILGFWIRLSYTVWQTCLNMSEQCLNIPKYKLIYQSKKFSKYAKVLIVPDPVAYCIYPSIFRTLTYSGGPNPNLRHIKNTVKDLRLSISFSILCYRRIFRTPSIFRALPSIYDAAFYSEPWNWYNKQWLKIMIGIADTINNK